MLGMGKTIERKFECDGPFVLCDSFVEKMGRKGMKEKTFHESNVEGQKTTSEGVKQFIKQHLKNRWTLRSASYIHKDPYLEKEDIRYDLEFDHNPSLKGHEFIQLGMPSAIKYKVTRTIEAI